MKIAMCHKTGSCPIGEISVVIAVSSKHRADSLKAIDFAINELKRTVSIWKKEIYEDGEATWKENSEQFEVEDSSSQSLTLRDDASKGNRNVDLDSHDNCVSDRPVIWEGH